MSDVKSWTAQDGRDWKKIDMVLEFPEHDDKGEQVLRPNGEPMTNLVKLDIFGQRVEEVLSLGVNVGNWVWANIRIQTRMVDTSRGKIVVNDIYLAEMRNAQKVANQ